MLSLMGDDGGLQPRYEVLLAAKLATTADELDVTVHELWPSGAIVRAAILPRIGKDVLITRAGREILGSVVSRDADRCEIEFDEQLDEMDVLLWIMPIPEDSAPAIPPRFRRPALRNSRPNREEWKLIQPSGYSVAKPAFDD
jgi:hypothetical protein